MPRELPNLDWLRVFASAAATESFSLAAAELHVTPGAVSQRIKALEAYLGVELFQRYAQGVRLTEAGQRYARRVLPVLEQLTAATRELLSDEGSKSVRVTILPALAQLWLGPRVDAFHKLHSNVTLEIWADPVVIDLRTSHFDFAIRYARPPFPGCDHRQLLLDELVPVASPARIESAGLDEHGFPKDVPLMVDTYWASDLDEWLGQTGRPRPAALNLQTFSLYSMVVEATLQGRGFMIGHSAVISDLLAEGRLVALSHQRVPTANQFHLLTKSGAPLSHMAETFADWVIHQAGNSG